MAITLTGSKSSGTLSAVGTYSVTVSTTPFSSGDYSVSRYAVLFTSAGVFKGIALVKGFTSTSVLALDEEFYDPLTDTVVTQVIGDLVHVSVNLSEVTVSGAGWTYTQAGPTVTDQLVFGTAGSQTSLVLFDESKTLFSTWAGSGSTMFFGQVGGVVILGRRANRTNNDVYSGCAFAVATSLASAVFVFQPSNAAANMFLFGGSLDNIAAVYGDRRGISVANANRCVAIGTKFSQLTVSASHGNCRFVNPMLVQSGDFQAQLFVATATVQGGYLQGSSSRTNYGVLRVGSAGTFNYATTAGERTVVRGWSTSFPICWSSTALSYTLNLTNFVSNSKSLRYSSQLANASATANYRYSDAYTNIVSGSVAQVRLDSDGSLEAAVLGSGTTWSPSVLRDSWTGATQNAGFPHGPWTYGIKRYGYAAVSGAIAASSYSLGSDGTADNVSFGGAVVQAPDTAVTLSESAALALATIDTYDALYDALIAWNCASVANAAYPSLGAYPCTSGGGIIDLGALDLVVDATAASAISVNTGSHVVTIKSAALAAGSKHSSLTTTGAVSTANGAEVSAIYTDATGTHVTVTAASLVSGSRVQLYNVTDATELLNTTLGSTGLTFATTWSSDKTIRLRADHPDYLPLEATGILTASGLTFLATQAEDTVYVGNGIDGSTVTEFTADGVAIHVDVSDPDGYTLVQRIYAWMQHYQTTSAGIASAFFGAMAASDSANYVIDQDKADIHLDNVTASPLMIVGGYLTRKDGSTVIAATSGSIQMDPGRAYVAPGGAAITVPEGERVILLQANGAHIARG